MSAERIAVFGYGSLVARASIEATLGESLAGIWPAELNGWSRGFTQARRNKECEKTFARESDGFLPEWVLGMNVHRAEGASVNGALLELTAAGRDRLDARELRYSQVDVAAEITADAPGFDHIYTYVARPEHHFPAAPDGAVILRSYAEAVEAAFGALGPGELERYRVTTAIPDVEIIDGVLVRDEIPPGNPTAW